jgi:hypothetical protein
MARGDQAAGEQLLLLHMTGSRRTMTKGHDPDRDTVGPPQPFGLCPRDAIVTAGHPGRSQAGQGPATMSGNPSRANLPGYEDASIPTGIVLHAAPGPHLRQGHVNWPFSPGQVPCRPPGGANVNGTARALSHTQISPADGAHPGAGASSVAAVGTQLAVTNTVLEPTAKRGTPHTVKSFVKSRSDQITKGTDAHKKRQAQKTIAARKAGEAQTRSYAKWAETVRELDSAVKFFETDLGLRGHGPLFPHPHHKSTNIASDFKTGIHRVGWLLHAFRVKGWAPSKKLSDKDARPRHTFILIGSVE